MALETVKLKLEVCEGEDCSKARSELLEMTRKFHGCYSLLLHGSLGRRVDLSVAETSVDEWINRLRGRFKIIS